MEYTQEDLIAKYAEYNGTTVEKAKEEYKAGRIGKKDLLKAYLYGEGIYGYTDALWGIFESFGGLRMANGKVVPATGCEEVCSRILELIIAYLEMMNYFMAKEDIKAFWKTLCAFIGRRDDAAILQRLYDEHMSDFNKARVSKEEFVAYMMKGV